MPNRSFRRAVVAAGLVLLTASGCASTSPTDPAGARAAATLDVSCPDPAARVRVPLRGMGTPPPVVDGLVMCTGLLRSNVIITNSTKDVWLVRPPAAVLPQQNGGVPTEVQAFRLFAAAGVGFWLEPGTSVTVAAAPDTVDLVIDKVNQGRWSTFVLLDGTATAAREKLPELIRNKKYRTATASCLEAGARMINTVAAERYTTQTLVGYLGLTLGGTQCSADLVVAERERQLLAFQRTGRSVAELKPAVFAQQASRVSSYLDDLLKNAGKLAQVF